MHSKSTPINKSVSIHLTQWRIHNCESLLIGFRTILNVTDALNGTAQRFEIMMRTFFANVFDFPWIPVIIYMSKSACPTEDATYFISRIIKSVNSIPETDRPYHFTRESAEKIGFTVSSIVQEKFDSEIIGRLTDKQQLYLVQSLARVEIAKIALNEFVTEYWRQSQATQYIFYRSWIPTYSDLHNMTQNAKDDTYADFNTRIASINPN
jgi:hypothetical protein